MTRSPGRSVGTRCCSTQARKARWLIGPSNAHGARSPSPGREHAPCHGTLSDTDKRDRTVPPATARFGRERQGCLLLTLLAGRLKNRVLAPILGAGGMRKRDRPSAKR